MAPALELRIDDDVRERLPDLRLHAIVFSGARVGMANRKLEPLRDRVLADVRERISAARDVRRIPTLAAFHRRTLTLIRDGSAPATLQSAPAAPALPAT